MKVNYDAVERAMAYEGCNQSDVAERMDKKQSTVSRMFAQIKLGSNINPRNVSQLAAALNVKVDALIADKDVVS